MGLDLFWFIFLAALYVIFHRHKRNYETRILELERSILSLKSRLDMHIEAAGQPQYQEAAEAAKADENIIGQEQPVPSEAHAPTEFPSEEPSALPEDYEITPAFEYDPAFDLHVFQENPVPDAEAGLTGKYTTDEAKADSTLSGLTQRWEEFKANVDWEMFTGVKLFSGLGGLALFIGAAFFVKYSIDRDLIPPALRLAIGAVTGIALIIASGYFDRARYNVLRQTLGASGVGVLYSIVFAATLYYQYLSKPFGFGLLALVSAAAFVLAVYYRGIAVSVLGALGAYVSPILVSTGQGSLPMLFIYLAIINIGMYQVARRLNSVMLLLIATAGTLATLSLGTFVGSIETSGLIVSAVWIANLGLFSVFVGLMKDNPEDNQILSLTGNILYLSMPLVALGIMNRTGTAPLLLLTAGMAGAVAVALRKQGWARRVIPYGAVNFALAFFWTYTHFDPGTMSWSFAAMLVYGAAGGLGPVVLIRKYGLDKMTLRWFQVFPVALGLMCLAVVLKNPQISFWFWPLILMLELMGIMVSLLFGAMIQAGLLVIFLIVGGLSWMLRMPTDFAGPGFYGFLLLSGALLSIAIVYSFLKLSAWTDSLNLRDGAVSGLSPEFGNAATEWVTVFPAMGAFIMLAATFWVQTPLVPHPGMATLICFLTLSLFLSKRLTSQSLGIVAMLSSLFAQGVWIFRPGLDQALFFSALTWSGALFCSAIIIPFFLFRSFEKWDRIWMGWAIYEVFQGLFLIWSADHLWPREISGWAPLVLAFIKLPVVFTMQSKLMGKTERNALLAFHGGVLLFYVSAIPVLLLDQGWLGLTLIFEAMLLLWLNRRVEHEGLRWVSSFMAPAGMLLLYLALPQMKGPDSMAVLNSAVLSVAAAVATLSLAVKLSAFPQQTLGKLNLPRYFLWLSIGSGFFLLNLVVADLFAKPPSVFNVFPGQDAAQTLCYSLVWLVFGASLWTLRFLSISMRTSGLALVYLGAGSVILMPFLLPDFVPGMQPIWNLGLPSYLVVLAVLFFLFFKEPREGSARQIRNLFLALFLISCFMAVKVEMNTLLQHGMPFHLFIGHTASMAAGSAAGWLAYGLALMLWPGGLDRPFRIAGLALILAGLIKTGFFPFTHSTEFASMTPLLNYPSLLFLFVTGMLICLTLNRPRQHWPFMRPGSSGFWGSILGLMAFLILNIEISSVFSAGRDEFSMLTYGSLSHQLAYSLGWMAYSISLLAAGIKWSSIRARWAALAFLVFTAFKIFFMDLWRLGQLYRVASFVGLAAVLILVSFLYQRFLNRMSQSENK